MNDIIHPRAIRTAEELTEFIRRLKAASKAGELVQVRPDPSPFATDVDVDDLLEDGPWPDYLELRFRVPGAAEIYKLSVDTYHGAGGTWAQE